jgi:ABC-2 type transport system ATP-binding protein
MSTGAIRSAFSGPDFKCTIACDAVSRWYGKVIAINGVTVNIGQGVVGLLGPNGAGKSTLLKLLVGLLRPTSGSISVLDRPAFGTPETRAQIGYCPEHDHFYEEMTGLKFVTVMTQLHGFGRAEAVLKARSALERVGLAATDIESSKSISEYSKGMRQKVKLAQALSHDPNIVVLDEPLTGTDPVSRHQIGELCRQLGEEGKTVIISSHVLQEVERITNEFILIDRGRLLAKGNVRDIRELIDQHPHRIELIVSDPRALAAKLVSTPFVSGVTVTGEYSVICETGRPDDCYEAIPKLAEGANVTIRKMTSPDNNLEAVFRYLTR